jgi:tetratricopeptide (TPR) repeat protein
VSADILGYEPIDVARLTAEASQLRDRAVLAGDSDMMGQAVASFDAVVTSTPGGSANREVAVANLAATLIAQYETTRMAGSLDRAIRILHEALGKPFVVAARRDDYLSLLGRALLRDAERSGNVTTIRKAVKLRRQALSHTRKQDPAYLERQSGLGDVRAMEFSMTGEVSAIKEAVHLHRSVVKAMSADDPLLAIRLSNLGNDLAWLAMRTGDAGALECAVERQREAVSAIRLDDPNEALILSNIATALLYDFEQNGSLDILDEAIGFQRAASDGTPEQHVEHAARLANLAAMLLSRFERIGDLDLFDEIVQDYRSCVDGTSQQDPRRVNYLFGLASALARRGERTGDLSSLDEAIELLRTVVDLTPDDDPRKPGRLSALAAAESMRFRETPADLSPLDRGISALTTALSLTSAGHQQRGMILSNLGALLHNQFEQTREQATLQEAIDRHRDAIAATPPQHSERGKRLANLVIALTDEARLSGDASSLDEAFSLCEQALDTMTAGDSGRAQTLIALGAAHECRFRLTGDASDLSVGLAAFGEVTGDTTAPARLRIIAGRDGGRLAASVGAVGDALRAFSAAVRLMDEAAWAGIERDDQERLLSQMAGLPMDAAAMAITVGDLELAVELLEQGRGVLLARQLEEPGHHAVLRERAPDLAEQLAEMQSALDQAAASGQISDDGPIYQAAVQSADQRISLARQRDSIMAQIRERADLADIVAARRFAELRATAEHGPVVIVNISSYRCDALVLTTDNVQLVTLPQLSTAEIGERAEALVDAADRASSPEITLTLGWLWDCIVEPVLRALGLTGQAQADGPLPHIWWCPTGVAAFLPLHAAGHYADGSPVGDTAIDLAISSYTPSLRTLLQLRRRDANHGRVESDGFLIVAMPETPGAANLPDAENEASDLRQRVPASTCLSGPAATTIAVTAAMPRHQWAHFSCHGRQDLLAPSHARLVLYDGSLTARQIAALQLSAQSFAFLSACDTYRGGASVPDESITLASALQLAGYQHVVATLWQISEVSAPEISRLVYDLMVKEHDGTIVIDVNIAAEALRAAVLTLRNESAGIPPMYWAAYIHTGP